MFSSWDVERPRCWYPATLQRASSLDQSTMQLEVRHRSSDVHREALATPNYVDSDDVDDFVVDLPVVAQKYKPIALQLETTPEVGSEDEGEPSPHTTSDAIFDADSSTKLQNGNINGHHESISLSGSSQECETLWQDTPHKKKVEAESGYRRRLQDNSKDTSPKEDI